MRKNRREFLKKSSIAGVGLSLTASPLNFLSAKSKKNSKVKLAFIGTGGRGKHLLNHLLVQQITSDFEIVAICDNYQPNLQAANKLCQKFGATPKTFDNHNKLISSLKVDGVVIATPLHQHAHIAIDCMNAGIHVLCEKSMARTLNDVKAMYDTHLSTGAILLIGHQRLFNQKYLNAMERIHAGELGDIGMIKAYWHRNNDWRRKVPKDKPHLEKQINWRLYKEYSAGLLTELMSHQLQIANWVYQKMPVSVVASGSNRYYFDGREVPDLVSAIFNYDDGSQFMYDTLTNNKTHGCEEKIIGKKGIMQLETNLLYKETPPPAPGILQLVNDIEKGIFETIPIGGASWAPETAVKYDGEEIFTGQEGDGTKEELVTFIKFIQEGKAPEWMSKEGYMTSIWSLLTEEAINTGDRITCPQKYIIT